MSPAAESRAEAAAAPAAAAAAAHCQWQAAQVPGN